MAEVGEKRPLDPDDDDDDDDDGFGPMPVPAPAQTKPKKKKASEALSEWINASAGAQERARVPGQPAQGRDV